MMRISSPDRARIAGLLGEIAMAIDALPDVEPVGALSVPKRSVTQLSGARVCALTGVGMSELRAIAAMSDSEFEAYLRDRDAPPDPAPELPLELPVSAQQPLSSITPSKANIGVAQFAASVRDITGEAAE